MPRKGALGSPDHSDPDLSKSAKGWPTRSPAWLIFGVLIGTLLAFGGAVIYSQQVASKLDDAALSIATNAAPAIEHLNAARTEILRIQLAAALAVHGAGEGIPLDRTPFDNSLSRLHGELSAYLAFPFYPNERDHYAEVEQATRSLEAEVSGLLTRIAARDARGAGAALRTRLSPAASHADEVIGQLVVFNAQEQHRLGIEIPKVRIHAARVGYTLEGVAAIFALALMALVVRATREYARALDERKHLAEAHATELAAFSAKLESIVRSTVTIGNTITRNGQLQVIFHSIADEARSIINADYCALGCGTDPELPFDPWVVSGVQAAEAEAIGRLPRPIGLLGAVMREGHTIRLAHPTKHPAFSGLPAHHPAMGPFLGVPIVHDRRNVGTLYLARKEGQPAFREDDERAAELLAAYVGVAIDNARLYNEAQAATRAREDLLATVSHDLKNPLSTIHMSTSLMLRRPGECNVADLAARIDGSVERMTRLIGDLLDAAKIEAGLLRTAGQPEGVGSLVEEAVEIFSNVAAEKSIRLVHRTPSSFRVLCERELILRVFSNLIGNAIKFTPHDGSVSVEVERIAGEIQFSVKDTGPGIPANHLPHVFDRYWQQEDSDRRGSGLGLYIAKGIVEAQGGRIWVESTLTKGTTFHFTLPAFQGRGDSAALSP